MSRTRIIATIGPASLSRRTLRALHDAGTDAVRLNGSHGTLAWHRQAIGMIRETLPAVPILFDLPGRKVRTAALAREPRFGVGDSIVLTSEPGHDGTNKVSVNFPDLHRYVEPGMAILADDGMLRFTVTEVNGRDIGCRADGPGILGRRKGINVPSLVSGAPTITGPDRDMIAFARENGLDFIAISFVESADQIGQARELTDGGSPRIIAKIESQGGLDRLAEIIDAADAVMIDRGDLSVETGLERLPLFQKRILEEAERRAKPSIVATEMLHTMIENPYPTKAEVSDITNAVLDGASAMTLSGETAVGVHPVEAVAVMRRISAAAEGYLAPAPKVGDDGPGKTIPQAIGEAAALLCRSLSITKIVAVTISGFAARSIASRRPKQPILAVSNDRMAARSFNLLPGTKGVHVDVAFSRTSTDHIVRCLEVLWRRGEVADADVVLVTAVGYPRSGNRMNLLETHVIGDLAETLGWREGSEVIAPALSRSA